MNTNVASEADDFAERVRSCAAAVGGPSELASLSGLSAAVIGKYMRGESDPSRQRLVAIAQGAGVSLSWLATGAGVMRPDVPSQLATLEPVDVPAGQTNAAGFVAIPRYDVEASAGAGRLWDRENVKDYLMFAEGWAQRALGVHPRHLVLITANGDSMEPVIRSGDLLLVDRSIDSVRDDAIYVLVLGDSLIVKRLQRFFGGALAIKSDNPAYIDQTMTAEEAANLRVAGRVRWIARVI